MSAKVSPPLDKKPLVRLKKVGKSWTVESPLMNGTPLISGIESESVAGDVAVQLFMYYVNMHRLEMKIDAQGKDPAELAAMIARTLGAKKDS